MAPPSTFPRLRELTPSALSAEILAALEHFLSFSLGAALAPREARLTGHPNDSVGVALTACDLLERAQCGAPLDGELEDYLLSLSALYKPVVGDSGSDLEELWAGDPKQTPDSLHGRLCTIVRACKAREALDAGEHPHTGWLAALASVSHQTVTAAVDSGEIKRVGAGRIDHADAVRWLESRGVPGIGRRPSK